MNESMMKLLALTLYFLSLRIYPVKTTNGKRIYQPPEQGSSLVIHPGSDDPSTIYRGNDDDTRYGLAKLERYDVHPLKTTNMDNGANGMENDSYFSDAKIIQRKNTYVAKRNHNGK